MAKSGRRRLPLTFEPTRGARNSDLISQVHAANKDSSSAQQLLDSGLIDAYQQASLYGNKHFDSSKWLLKNLGPMPKPLRLLDVGSLRLVYAKYKWIDATYIDLHSRHPKIQTADLLTFQPVDNRLFHVVCLSLVLNFVGCAEARYDMLVKARQLVDPENGLVSIVLPRAVLFNSRRMTLEYFEWILTLVGLKIIHQNHTKKLSMFIARYAQPSGGMSTIMKAPNLVLNGANNFKITPKFC
jgi:25S rRNA (adenine2142-N1)-methyltransferase